MKKLAIYGSGGFGRELIAPTHKFAQTFKHAPELCFISDSEGADACGLQILPFEALDPGDGFIIAVGDGKIRQRLESRCLSAGLVPMSLLASSAIVGPDVDVGEGAVLCDFSMVTVSARIGRQFQANIYSYVAHDCVIGDYVTFAPRVCCNGNVHIGDGAYIGTGAVIKQGTPDKPLRIGKGAVVGMGAVVTRDVPDGATVIGNPARVMG